MRSALLAVLLAASVTGGARAQTASPAPAMPSGCSALGHGLTGTLCLPRGGGRKHPAVILLGGSEGGNSMAGLAPRFAAHGYAAASVAYFRAPGQPDVLVDVPVETVERAIDVLRTTKGVDAAHVGILGISKGGELALLAASTYSAIKAVVAVVPSPIAYFGLGERNMPTGCSWSERGKPLPCVPPDAQAGQQIGMEFFSGKPVVLKTLYDASRASNPQTTAAAFFPLQRIRGPVLCLAGADDLMWNSPAHCALTSAYLRRHGHRFADRTVVYPDAGHLFLFASTPADAMTSIEEGGTTIDFGGTRRGDTAAFHAAWQQIWTFLAESL